jgi:hypothetical protein
MHEFCANPNNQPSMSSESVAAKIRQNILPKCHEDLLGETDNPGGLPTYNELLQMLDLEWVLEVPVRSSSFPSNQDSIKH